ncbi:MAG: hypothetical protein ACREUE_13585 [Panacagrimonas sp.]
MLKWILGGVAAVVVIFLIVVAMQPSDFKVERTATMRAPAPAAFAQVNDFQNWRAWHVRPGTGADENRSRKEAVDER